MARLFEYCNISDDRNRAIGESTAGLAQTFRATDDYYITALKVKLVKGATGYTEGDMVVSAAVYDTDGLLHPDTLKKASTTTLNYDIISTTAAWYTFLFNIGVNGILLSGTTYAIVLHLSVFDGSYPIYWRYINTNAYTNGGSYYHATDGEWKVIALTGADFMFETWGINYIDGTENIGSESAGVIKIKGTTFRYLDAQGNERWLEGQLVE